MDNITYETRLIIKNFLNSDMNLKDIKELANMFEIEKCENGHCDNYELEEDLDHICESCRENR